MPTSTLDSFIHGKGQVSQMVAWPFAAGMSRRRSMKLLSGLALTVLAGKGIGQETEDAAWELWSVAVKKIIETYYEPVTEEKITRGALEELIKHSSGAAAKTVLPESLGATSEELQTNFRDTIRRMAALPPRKTLFDLVERALGLYCEKRLRFSSYQTASDTSALANLAPGAIGLLVDHAPTGKYFCLPRMDEPAAKAGVKQGDELVSIDGKTVEGSPLAQVMRRLRGLEGTTVTIEVRRKSGRALKMTVKRQKFRSRIVELEDAIGGPILRIPTLNSTTVAEVKKLLSDLKPDALVTLDLRGNFGGSMQVAADIAGLLGMGKVPVAKLKFHGTEETITSAEDSVYQPKSLLILQDGLTASSSEMLIVALQEAMPGAVIVVGANSYGKGLFQEITPITGGGTLTITQGELLSMKGTTWDHKGIPLTFATTIASSR